MGTCLFSLNIIYQAFFFSTSRHKLPNEKREQMKMSDMAACESRLTSVIEGDCSVLRQLPLEMF